jgi:predicted nuclease of predicted toxin-antitoxin system
MKLLFDHQLSPRLVDRLADLYPNSSHVLSIGLDRAPDGSVWEFARANGFTIVSKDSDFGDMGFLRGYPPKVVWVRIGNCSTQEIETLLRRHQQAVEQLEADPESGLLVLL